MAGPVEARNAIFEHEFYFRQDPKVFKLQVLVTSFEIILQEQSRLKVINWKYLIVDEAHRMKVHFLSTFLNKRTINPSFPWS
jgi:SNF2 family DNA or RNA helicase